MTTILAIDTSSERCSVALLHEGRIYARGKDIPREHTLHLLPMVDELLAETALSLPQLDAIAYGKGPGSFTGLRITMGMVQGLAFGADKPVVPVSTLESMALDAWQTHAEETASAQNILVTMDARMQEVYWGVFRLAADSLAIVEPEQVGAVNAPLDYLAQADADNRIWCCGNGFSKLNVDILNEATQVSQYWDNIAPRAEVIVQRASALYAKGHSCAIDEAPLTYLRNEVAWQKREKIRQ